MCDAENHEENTQVKCTCHDHHIEQISFLQNAHNLTGKRGVGVERWKGTFLEHLTVNTEVLQIKRRKKNVVGWKGFSEATHSIHLCDRR